MLSRQQKTLPSQWEAAYQYHGLHWRYINCEVPPPYLQDAVKGAKAMGWQGFNCSIPHKVAIIDYLDELGASAKIIGAVNTVVHRDGKWVGENTDGKGFVEAVKETVDPIGKDVVLFGAGGAARAVAIEMALAGAEEIIVVNRNEERGRTLVRLINENTNCTAHFHHWEKPYKISPITDIVINATSIGLFPNVDQQLLVNFDSLASYMVVADGIHNPPRTHLLKTAAQKGCKTVDGLQMLVNQGVLAVEYWTGVKVDASVMHAALKIALQME